jgi:hypothetical protein
MVYESVTAVRVDEMLFCINTIPVKEICPYNRLSLPKALYSSEIVLCKVDVSTGW